MKALVVEAYGSEERLRWRDFPEPGPEADGVLVAVTAVSVDWSDVVQRAGRYPGGPTPPFVSGSGFAGTVVESAGPRVTPGTRVFGLRRGAAAELIRAAPHSVFETPSTLTDVEAAGLPGQFFTADVATRMYGRVGPDDAVLVQAGAGSLGSAAIQLCRAAGVRTLIATAGSPSKFELMTELGATHCIDYSTEPLADRVLEITGGRGADLIIESVGGDVLEASFDCIAPLGRLVSVGASSGKSTRRFRLQTLFERNISVAGFTFNDSIRITRDFQEGTAQRVISMFERGELRPVVRQVFPITEAASAHRHLASRAGVGRTVMTIP
jgi:NADPH2:quinone reductase